VEVSGHVPSQVYITVLDENDNSPRFDFTSDSAISVPEDCTVGQRVATVKAQDPDAGSNGQVGTSEIVQSRAVSEGSHSPSARGVTGAVPILSGSRSSRLCKALSRRPCPHHSPCQGWRQSYASCQPCLGPRDMAATAGHGSAPAAS